MVSSPTCVPFEAVHSIAHHAEAFIFDCDGTLADTMPLHHRAWRHALARAGAGFDFDWALFVSRAGMSLEQTVRELNQQFGTSMNPDRVAADQRSYYEAALEEVVAIDPVLQFAKHAYQRFPISVASGSLHRHVVHTLELIGARPYFDIIITPQDVKQGKPAPDMFLLAAERMGVPAHKCLVIEDSELGIVAARRAGMHAALVSPCGPAALEVSA